jgi:hypothetical protein
MFVNCVWIAQGGPYFVGLNSLNDLVTSVTDAEGDDLLTVSGRTITQLYDADGNRTSSSITDANDFKIETGEDDDPYSFETWNFQGVSYSEKEHVYYEPGKIDDDGNPPGPNFIGITGVNWANYGYIQKADKPVILLQSDIYDPRAYNAPDNGNPNYVGAIHNSVQDNDCEFLTSLNFSGNKFYHFELDGGGVTPVTTIDFSNNPTLETLTVTNCPDLTEVNITNSGLPLSKVYAISRTVETGLKYAPQGVVSLRFPAEAVDLSAELTLGNTASEITWTGAQPIAADNGVFTFDAALDGQTVTATLTNSRLAAFGSEGLTYEIVLQSGNGIQSPDVDRKVWSVGNELFISSGASGSVRIYTIDGRLVKQQAIGVGTSSIALDSRLYIVQFNNGTVKKVVVK